MTEPKVGQIWLVDSRYAWCQCLVLITSIRQVGLARPVYGAVLDTEGDRAPEVRDGWVFYSEFIKLIQEA
jgi:hypothetical protein